MSKTLEDSRFTTDSEFQEWKEAEFDQLQEAYEILGEMVEVGEQSVEEEWSFQKHQEALQDIDGVDDLYDLLYGDR